MKVIGVFPEEQEAYDLVMNLSWILPTVVIVGALLDAFFVGIYMNFAHPWVGILSTEEPNNEQEEVIDTSSPREEEDTGYFMAKCAK